MPGTLLARARAEAEQPWLFSQRGLDWRWVSWGEAAARMLERVEELTAVRSVAGCRVGYSEDGSPQATILDLAIVAAGAVPVPRPPVPLPPEPLATAELDLRLVIHRRNEGEPTPATATETGRSSAAVVELPEQERRPSWRIARPPEGGLSVSGPAVAAAWQDDRWTELPAAALAAAVDRLSFPPVGSAADGREIAVQPRALADAGGRAFLAWSIVTGAALVLEPDAGQRPVTAQWVRPTLFAGDRAELAAFYARLTRRRRRGPRRRLPLGRLHTVVALDEEPEEADLERWRRLGVAVTSLVGGPATHG